MEINADFAQRIVMHGARMPWVDSPMAGVQRRMLDRIGDEVARATSLVRYAPGSDFSRHVHGGGEEFLVVEGVFQDEHGDFPVGSYIRNPPGSAHTPRSEPGCVIFVKLWQFDPADQAQTMIHTDRLPALASMGRPGIEIQPLFRDTREDVRIETWAPGTRSAIDTAGGAELLVLTGQLTDGEDQLAPQSWLRVPDGAALAPAAGPDGAKVWIKTGHLRFVTAPTR